MNRGDDLDDDFVLDELVALSDGEGASDTQVYSPSEKEDAEPEVETTVSTKKRKQWEKEKEKKRKVYITQCLMYFF